jgi:hypothetical protein
MKVLQEVGQIAAQPARSFLTVNVATKNKPQPALRPNRG